MLSMAKPEPPGPLRNCVEQNPSPTTWACVRVRGAFTHAHIARGASHPTRGVPLGSQLPVLFLVNRQGMSASRFCG